MQIKLIPETTAINQLTVIFNKIPLLHDEITLYFRWRITSKKLWPPWSPDLTQSEFYLWGTLKNNVYAGNPQTINELKHKIISAIESISAEELVKINNNFIRRCQRCLGNNGGHFQHQMWAKYVQIHIFCLDAGKISVVGW